MTSPNFDILTLLLAAKKAGATGVRVLPDGSLDIRFDDAERSIKSPAKRLPYGGGVHRIKKTPVDGQEVTYWYAYRGGPRISEAEAQRIIAAAKVVPFTKPAP